MRRLIVLPFVLLGLTGVGWYQGFNPGDRPCGGISTMYGDSMGRAIPRKFMSSPKPWVHGHVRSLEAIAALVDSRGGDHIVGWMAFDDKAHPWVLMAAWTPDDIRKHFFRTPEAQRANTYTAVNLNDDLPSHLSLEACPFVEDARLHAKP